MCDCMVDSDVGTGDFSPVLGIAHVRSHVSPEMDQRNNYPWYSLIMKQVMHIQNELLATFDV